MKKPVKIVLFVFAVVVIIIIIWIVGKKLSTTPAIDSTAQTGLGAQVFDKVEKDPIEGNIPETNPFNTGVNPYSNAYKNPFSQ